MKLNCVVVDDRFSGWSYLSIIIILVYTQKISNAIEAKKLYVYSQCWFNLLDIEMPVISGFDFLDLSCKSLKLFITSKQYADYDATDYLQNRLL
jgi:hypothetical protein